MQQRFPEKTQFKTEVDGKGKVGKQNTKCEETAGFCSPCGFSMFQNLGDPHEILVLKTDHKQHGQEKSPKLLDGGMTTTTRRSLVHVTKKNVFSTKSRSFASMSSLWIKTPQKTCKFFQIETITTKQISVRSGLDCLN
jgi:hypothetical protein